MMIVFHFDDLAGSLGVLEGDPGDGGDHGGNEDQVPLFQVNTALGALKNSLGRRHKPLKIGNEGEDATLGSSVSTTSLYWLPPPRKVSPPKNALFLNKP